jgi:ADP-dependent NAD(P)H-hydrate dehydratase / NAD(P)H-hydrate epimerase
VKIVSVAQMRALEAAAFAAGISEVELQRQAGTAVAEEVYRCLEPGGRVVVLVGHGNNGRDGAVAAGWLLGRGVRVDLVLAPRHAVTLDELADLRAKGAATVASDDPQAIRGVLGGATLAVDALAGIGVKGALREPLKSLARELNAFGERLRIVALDLPSGVDADTGEVPGEAVWADSTVTLGGVKQGLLRFPAAERVGLLIPREIEIPPAADSELPYTALDAAKLGRLVPPRPLDAHKYRFGRVLVIAGSDHFLGAPVLSAGGAARVGAGLVTVGSTRDVRLNVAAHLPEVTFTATDIRSADGATAATALEPYLRSHASVVIGPGLGRGPSITAFVAEVLRLRPREHRLVVDADGLTALAEISDWPSLLGPNAVLTPHSGELERLVGQPPDATEPAWQHAGRLAQQWGCVLVAKGPFTCVAAPDGRVGVWPRANPALATGGTGDVLAGLTAGLLGQGAPVWEAAQLAVGVHALAAEKVVRDHRWRTLLASDLLDAVPATLRTLADAAATRPR